MLNYDDVAKERIDKHNPNWSQIPDHPYRTFIIVACGSRKIKESL